MNIQIINTGSELMLGRVLNTHQQWLCRQLADRGYVVGRQIAVDDTGPAIQQAVREALADADLIIVTGGLGPTSDDRTRDLIAQLLNRELKEDPALVRHIESFFTSRKRPMPASTRVQALVPTGATVLSNAHGTAPGLVMKAARAGTREALLIMLPGPPRELRPMFAEQVVPLITQHFPLQFPFVCRTLKTTGLGESFIEERIAQPLAALTAAGLDLGYCARNSEVDVRLVSRGETAGRMVDEAERIACQQLGEAIFGYDEESLEGVVVRELTKRQQTLALAESCTGGFIAHRVTNVPGASAVLRGGLVTYSNESKQKLLGVQEATLAAHGAVSEATVCEMAAGARTVLNADYGLAVTGIAGPTGDTPGKPVGTVWLGLATAKRTFGLRQYNPYDRETFKFVTSQQALDILRRELVH